MNKIAKFSMVTILVLGLASAAFADTAVFTGITLYGQGTITGTNTPTLTFSNALVTNFMETTGPCTGTPGCAITNGYLDLTATGGTPNGTGYSYTGGSITIMGEDSALGIGPGSTLFTATLANSTLAPKGTGEAFAGNLVLPSISFNSLLGSFGVPTSGTNTESVINFTTDGGATISQSTTTVQYPHVPDGGITLMLLGGVLVGFESLRRRVSA